MRTNVVTIAIFFAILAGPLRGEVVETTAAGLEADAARIPTSRCRMLTNSTTCAMHSEPATSSESRSSPVAYRLIPIEAC